MKTVNLAPESASVTTWTSLHFGYFQPEDIHVRKTPSFLKGLAETRARLAGEIARYEELLKDVGASLELARRQLDGCDLILKRVDNRIDPTRIQPLQIVTTGRRGVLRDVLIRLLKEATPEPLSTTVLTAEVAVALGREIIAKADRRQWQNNSVKRQLQRFVAQGLVERIEGTNAFNAELAFWRWKSGPASVDHLKVQLEAQGAAVQQYDDAHE